MDKIAFKKAVLEALEKSLGVVTTACKSVGIGRTQFYNWLKHEPVNELFVRILDLLQTQYLNCRACLVFYELNKDQVNIESGVDLIHLRHSKWGLGKLHLHILRFLLWDGA